VCVCVCVSEKERYTHTHRRVGRQAGMAIKFSL